MRATSRHGCALISRHNPASGLRQNSVRVFYARFHRQHDRALPRSLRMYDVAAKARVSQRGEGVDVEGRAWQRNQPTTQDMPSVKHWVSKDDTSQRSQPAQSWSPGAACTDRGSRSLHRPAHGGIAWRQESDLRITVVWTLQTHPVLAQRFA